MKLGDLEVVKISDEVPYFGHVKFYVIPDNKYDSENEWIWDNSNGTYQVVGTETFFYISTCEIRMNGELETHPVIDHLAEKYGVPTYRDDDDGPYGGAFASQMDYYNWRFGRGFVKD